MFSGPVSIIFVISLVVIVALSFLRYLELRWGMKIFRSLDSFMQSKVTALSHLILNVSVRIREFLLVHLYNMSSETVKGLFKGTMNRREALLDKLSGKLPKLGVEVTETEVSPYLKEISRIDRKEE